jgi:primase-polymerase (primpol)-like protein
MAQIYKNGKNITNGALCGEGMYSLRQFIIVYLQLLDNGGFKKIPLDHKTLTPHDPHDSSIWLSYNEAMAVPHSHAKKTHVGFVFTENDPYFLIDVDNSYQWTGLAQEICDEFEGCFMEESLSERSIHIIGQYNGEEPQHVCRNRPLNIELYTSKRFVILTGRYRIGDPDFEATEQLNDLIATYFRKE